MSAPRQDNHRRRVRRPPLFVVEINGELVDARVHAEQAGRENLPESWAAEPNEVERAILRQHQEDHVAAVGVAREEIVNARAELGIRKRSLPHARDLQLVVERAKAQIDESLADSAPLATLYRAWRDAELAYRRAAVDLNREPRYPDSRLLHVGVLVFLWLLEGALNSAFFAGTSPQGWLGGFTIALGAAAVNVLTGFAVGKAVLPYRNAPQKVHRLLARGAIGLYVAFVLVLNAGFAYWREVALAASGQTTAGWSLESLLLFGLGVAASAIALADGYHWDDPHPGVGPAHRTLVKARREYEEAKAVRLRALQEFVRAIPPALKKILHDTEQSMAAMTQLHARVVGEVNWYDEDRPALDRRCAYSLDDYRARNRRVRGTTAPAYFATLPEPLSDLLSERDVVGAFEVEISAATALLEELGDEASRIEREIGHLVSEVAHRFHASALTLERAIDEANQVGGTRELAPLVPTSGTR